MTPEELEERFAQGYRKASEHCASVRWMSAKRWWHKVLNGYDEHPTERHLMLLEETLDEIIAANRQANPDRASRAVSFYTQIWPLYQGRFTTHFTPVNVPPPPQIHFGWENDDD